MNASDFFGALFNRLGRKQTLSTPMGERFRRLGQARRLEPSVVRPTSVSGLYDGIKRAAGRPNSPINAQHVAALVASEWLLQATFSNGGSAYIVLNESRTGVKELLLLSAVGELQNPEIQGLSLPWRQHTLSFG